MFEILRTDTNEVLDTADNPADANTLVLKFKSQGLKVRMQRKSVADADPTVWHERERKRLSDGTYKPLPNTWTSGDWIPPLHFAHISRDKESVSYTPDDASGFADRQVKLPPNRYLARFAAGMRSEQISIMTHLFFDDDRFVIEFDKTENGFEFVFDQKGLKNYSSGYDSCMGYGKKHFNTPKHPSAAYAAGDLAVAFIRNPVDKEKVIARAVVWPEKKTSNRPYGIDEGMRLILENRLRLMGYDFTANFAKAKVHRIDITKKQRAAANGGDPGMSTLLMPYVDGDYSYVKESDDNFLEFTNSPSGAYSAQSSSGYICVNRPVKENEFRCDSCSFIFGGSGSSVHDSRSRSHTLCSHCRDSVAFLCGMTDSYRHLDFPNDMIMVSLDTRVRGWIEAPYVAECHRTGEFFDTRVFGPLVTVRNAQGEVEEICSHFRVESDSAVEPTPTRRTVARAPRTENQRPGETPATFEFTPTGRLVSRGPFSQTMRRVVRNTLEETRYISGADYTSLVNQWEAQAPATPLLYPNEIDLATTEDEV